MRPRSLPAARPRSALAPLPAILLGPARAEPAVPDRVTFAEHVAPIIYQSCTPCHRPGQGAPFALLGAADARKHGAAIRAVTADRQMPPWPPEAGWGHFQDERRLSAAQVATLARWGDTGMAEKLPPPPSSPAAPGPWARPTWR